MSKQVDEDDIQVLIDGTKQFFQQVVDRAAEVGAPYLVENGSPMVSDYTGMIAISGARDGCVYFTAPSAMLRHILLKHGETNVTPTFMADVVGEAANTISGNARRVFGQEFLISTPKVIQGRPDFADYPLASRSFVVPITWQHYKAALVVSLQ